MHGFLPDLGVTASRTWQAVPNGNPDPSGLDGGTTRYIRQVDTAVGAVWWRILVGFPMIWTRSIVPMRTMARSLDSPTGVSVCGGSGN